MDALTLRVVTGEATDVARSMLHEEQQLALTAIRVLEGGQDNMKMCVFAAAKDEAAVRSLRGDKNVSISGLLYPHGENGDNLKTIRGVFPKWELRKADEIAPVFCATTAKSEPGSCLSCGNDDPEYQFDNDLCAAFADNKSHSIGYVGFETEVSPLYFYKEMRKTNVI